jgi:hypothetical protein
MCHNCDSATLFPPMFTHSFGGPKKPHPKFLAYCKEEFEKATNPRFFGSKILIQYLNDEYNQRYGIFIAYKDGNALRFGWSICQTALDKWDKFVGFHYAFKRSTGDIQRVPASITDSFGDFIDRAMNYFKVKPEEFISNVGTPVTE